MTLACLAVVFSLAAGILFVLDWFTLRSGLSEEERKAAIAKRTERWGRRWGFFYFLMAIAALVVNAFNLGHEPIGWRFVWFVLAALVVLGFLSKGDGDD
jgi:hypothetical protein